MSPYLNEGYGETHLQRDWVIIQPIHKVERLRRGMVVIFPYVHPIATRHALEIMGHTLPLTHGFIIVYG
jgi:hypothetical protein